MQQPIKEQVLQEKMEQPPQSQHPLPAIQASDPKANLIFLRGNDHLIAGKWKLMNKLGSGSFGDIYIGLNPSDNEKVAIKLVSRSNTLFIYIGYIYLTF